MWQRFTERARKVVFFSQEEAGKLGHNSVGAEHLLLGLLRENDSVAAQILDRLGIGRERLRAHVEKQAVTGSGRVGQDMTLSPPGKRVIDLAYDEARQLSNNYIGTEHLLLALLRMTDNIAGAAMNKAGIELERARLEVLTLQGNDSMGPEFLNLKHTIAEDEHGLNGSCLLSMADLNPEQVLAILATSSALKAERSRPLWSGTKSMAMVFEKPSLRTRVTFELGLKQLGGIPIILGPEEIGLGKRESVEDAARNLERWVDGIMARVFSHDTLVGLASNCRIPVINGLSDREHPCQALTDLFTIQEHKGTLEGLKLAYIGDGNNVLHSLILSGAVVGMQVAAACPPGYQPDSGIVEQAKSLAGIESAISVLQNPLEAVGGADVVYTDVWTSMGQEAESEVRLRAFQGYQVDSALMAGAKQDAIFMHCLPAHRGEEVTVEVIDGPQSVVFDQAENRLHVQKAIMALLLGA